MIGGVTRRGLPHLSGVPHHHVNRLNKSILRADCLCAAHISKTTRLCTCRVVHFCTFLYISLCSLHNYKVNFHHGFMEGASTPQRFFLSPSKLEFGLHPAPESLLASYWPRTDLALSLFSAWSAWAIFC